MRHKLARLTMAAMDVGIIAVMFIPATVRAQVKVDRKVLEASLEDTRSGRVDVRGVEVIAEAGAVEAIPALEEEFVAATDPHLKLKIASGLVRLRDADDTYFNFLLEQATLALDSDMPEPFHVSGGNAFGQQPSQEFVAWAQAHHLDIGTAVQTWTYGLPTPVWLLAETGDTRAIPLLRRALQSKNLLIVNSAAKGLALVQDKDSIPLIIDAVHRLSPDGGRLVAESLIYLDDPRAQETVDRVVPKERAAMLREARAQGRGVFGW